MKPILIFVFIMTLYFISYCLYIPKINQKIEYVNKKMSFEKIKQLRKKILQKEVVRKRVKEKSSRVP